MDIEVNRDRAEHRLGHHAAHWLRNQAGNPNISIRLWTGDEVSTGSSHSVGYRKGLIEIHGDFLAVANEVMAALSLHREHLQ